MKGLKKLVLATAVAAAPFAQAELTAMDDSFLEGMTGQAGITLDLNLNLTIEEIRYADEDGSGEDVGDGGYLTMSNISVYGDQGTSGNQAHIKGVTIDVDSADGIVIGLGQIGGTSNISKGSNLDLSADTTLAAVAAATGADFSDLTGAQAAVLTGDYWTGVNITTDFGINGTKAGSLAIKNFTNFVPNALAVEGQNKFGYTLGGDIQLTNDDAGSTNLIAIGGASAGITTIATALAGGVAADITETIWDAATAAYVADNSNGFATALAAGNYVDASISISAGGAAGTEGLTIDAEIGFVIQEMSFTDDGNAMGIHNFTMYDTDVDGNIKAFSVTGLTIDVVGAADNFVATNSNATAALQIAGLNTSGTIAMGDIFIGDHDSGSLGAVSIKNIDMSDTQIFIYGH